MSPKLARLGLIASSALLLAAAGQSALARPPAGPLGDHFRAAQAAPSVAPLPPANSGVIRVQSVLSFDETIARIQQSVAVKGIRFFANIDQSKLAASAGIALRPSHLLIFGNPPLGIKFLTSNPYAGLDWPVRMLVTQDADGKVWIAYTDFDWIARRYAIADRGADFKMASEVAASIAASAAKP
jgi:uncharacterized protein (DUF302 family)